MVGAGRPQLALQVREAHRRRSTRDVLPGAPAVAADSGRVDVHALPDQQVNLLADVLRLDSHQRAQQAGFPPSRPRPACPDAGGEESSRPGRRPSRPAHAAARRGHWRPWRTRRSTGDDLPTSPGLRSMGRRRVTLASVEPRVGRAVRVVRASLIPVSLVAPSPVSASSGPVSSSPASFIALSLVPVSLVATSLVSPSIIQVSLAAGRWSRCRSSMRRRSASQRWSMQTSGERQRVCSSHALPGP